MIFLIEFHFSKIYVKRYFQKRKDYHKQTQIKQETKIDNIRNRYK